MIHSIFLLFGLGVTEIILILAIILLIFGGRKIPELMRGMGKGIKGFKEEMKKKEEKPDKDEWDIKE